MFDSVFRTTPKSCRIVPGKGVSQIDVQKSGITPEDVLCSTAELNLEHTGFRDVLFRGFYFSLEKGKKDIVMTRATRA